MDNHTKLVLITIALMVSGWGLNLYKLARADFEAPYKTEMIRTVSLVPLIGAVTGWMDIGEEVQDEK